MKSRTLARPMAFALLAICFSRGSAIGQEGAGRLTLAAARQQAQQTSPTLAALRAAVDAADARQRQGGAHPNPTIGYSREQTSASAVSTNQDIAALEQRVEIGGQAGARTAAGKARAEVARARLALAAAELNEQVARAYADV